MRRQPLTPKSQTLAFVLCLFSLFYCLLAPLSAAQTAVTMVRQHYGLGTLWGVAYSPDGNYILTGGSAGAFMTEVDTGKVVRMFPGYSPEVACVAFSPDGTRILTGGWDGTVKIWDVADGTELHTLVGHTKFVRSVAFSPDSMKALTGGDDQTAKLWNASDGSLIRTIDAHPAGTMSVAFSPDGTKILTGGYNGWGVCTAKLWNIADGALIQTFFGHSSVVISVAFSPDGSKILTGSLDATAKLWNALDGTEIRTFSGHREAVYCAAFSPDGTKILAGGGEEFDGVAILWNASDGTEIRTFSGHESWLHSAVFSPDGTKILTASGHVDNVAKLWRTSDATLLHTFSDYNSGVLSVAFSPDGTAVIMGGYGGLARLSNTLDGTTVRSFFRDGYEVESVAFSPDGTRVLTGGGGFFEARLWDAFDGTMLRVFSASNYVSAVAFSPDGTTILAGNTLWDARNGSEIFTLPRGGAVAFSPDGRYLLMGGWLYDAQSGTELHEVHGVVFSPDGSQVLGPSGSDAKLWDASDGTEILVLSGHTEVVAGVAFSPDGTRVLTGSEDRTAKLWNTSDGTGIRTFSGHIGTVESVAFSPNGTMVLTGSMDGTTRLWEIWPAKAVIVAGGGPFAGNAIAEQTSQLAAYCYKICRRRGYAPNEIQYLSAFGPQDADGDGNDDVDAHATPAELQRTLDTFASDTARLFIYMVDHGYHLGDEMYFQMNPTQTLAASDLDAWLDDLQTSPTRPAGPNCHVTLIVDTCYSGNFLSACTPPTGKRRLVIASTTDDAVAVFLPPTSLTSFSYQFLGALYMGYKVQQAFVSAHQFFQSLDVVGQSPWIDADGDGIYTPGVDDASTGPAAEEFFGTSWAYAAGGGWEPPAFADFTPTHSPSIGTSVTIWVEMLANQNPERVWATILAPEAEPLAGQAVTDLPRVELVREGTTQRWSAPFGPFETVGDYVVAHVAAFEGTRITQPVYSILSVGAPANPPPIKAIIISGSDGTGAISSQTIALANLAYRVSRHRGYEVGDIHYLSAYGNQDADGDLMNDVTGPSTVANIQDALANWASQNCERLLIYLVGPGEQVGGEYICHLSAGETLRASDVDGPLDTLQNAGVADVVIVADFPHAAQFLQGCQPPAGKQRALIAGTKTPNAVFLAPPQLTSFSFNFLSAAHMGHNLKRSFVAARQFFNAWTGFNQRPWLDDNGDGRSDKWDGQYAQTLHWGYPWAFAGPEGSELPFILEADWYGRGQAGGNADLWVELMEGPVPQRVIATIIPPNVSYAPGQAITGFPTVDLAREGETWRWSATAHSFTQSGIYTVLYQALYEDDRLSVPAMSYVWVGTGAQHWHLY